jgi:hypothetical protein
MANFLKLKHTQRLHMRFSVTFGADQVISKMSQEEKKASRPIDQLHKVISGFVLVEGREASKRPLAYFK